MTSAPAPLPHTRWSELSAQLGPDARTWLTQLLADAAQLTDSARLRVAFARIGRKVGGGSERIDAARLVLLSAALAQQPPDAHATLVGELYRTGEQGEQVSVLRALPKLPEPARFLTLGVEACRTNSLAVFAAIANDNDYPASHFPELHFDQLVLKAIFVGLPVQRIVGLAERATPELRRMVGEYAAERRAAGRAVPADVDYVIALCER